MFPLSLFLPMYSMPHKRISLHCTFQFQHSVRNVTCTCAPLAHTHTVNLLGSLMKGYHMGCLWCTWLGEETCVASVEGERWCVKARLICLWLALIKVSPRRAVNTHGDSVVIKLQRVLQELSHSLCLLFPQEIHDDCRWCLFAFQIHLRHQSGVSHRGRKL